MTDAYGGIGGGAIAEFAIADAGGGAPALLDLLRSGEYAVVVVQEMHTAGSSLVYRMYLSNKTWTTLPTDTLPSVTFGGEITAGPVIDATMSFGRGAQNNGEQHGSCDLIVHADGVPVETVGQGVAFQGLTRIRREKVVGGWPTKIMIGDPPYGLDSFTTVWQGVGESLSADGVTKAQLTFRDNRAALSRGILSTFAGTGGAEGTAEMAGKLKPRHYGAPKNASPVLIDPTLNIYFVSDRAVTVALPAAYDGAKALTVDSTSLTTYAALASHSVASGSWAQAIVPGGGTFVKLGAPPKRLTVDFADVLTVPAIIRAVLEAAGLASASIIIETEGYPFGSGTDHSSQWQAVQQVIQEDAAGYCYISEQSTPNDIVDSLCKGIGWSRYLDDFGRERFTAPDYLLSASAVAGVDYTILETGPVSGVVTTDGASYTVMQGGDVLSMREVDLPSTMWPPNGRERLLANKNHTQMTETDILAGAADAMRQFVLKAGDERTVESAADIFGALKDAVDPEALDTHIVDATYLPTLGDWLLATSALSDGRGGQSKYLTKRQVFELTLPMEFYATLPPFRTVKFSHSTFYPDAPIYVTGQLAPTKTDWQTKTRTYCVYAEAQKYSTVFAATFTGPSPGTSLSGVSGLARSGSYVYAACMGRNSLAVLNVTAPESPSWVAEAVGTAPGTGEEGAAYVALSGSYAFVTCPFRNSLLIANVSTPSSPSFVAEIQGPNPVSDMVNPRGVLVDGGYAFVVGNTGGSVSVINVSVPTSPVWVTEFFGPSPGASLADAWAIAKSGHYLFVTCAGGSSGLAPTMAVIDVANPTSPVWVTSVSGQDDAFSYNASPRGITINGTAAYLASYSTGRIIAVDISIPTAPVITAEASSPAIVNSSDGPQASSNSATSVVVSKGYAYMSSDITASVSVFDLSNPLKPVWISETGLNALSQAFGMSSVLAVDDFIYASSPTRSAVLVIA